MKEAVIKQQEMDIHSIELGRRQLALWEGGLKGIPSSKLTLMSSVYLLGGLLNYSIGEPQQGLLPPFHI